MLAAGSCSLEQALLCCWASPAALQRAGNRHCQGGGVLNTSACTLSSLRFNGQCRCQDFGMLEWYEQGILGVLGSKRGSGHCGREESSFLEKPRQLVTCGGTGLCPGHWAPPAPFPAAASPSPTRRGQGGDRGRGHIRPPGKLLIHGATRLTGPWQGLEALV